MKMRYEKGGRKPDFLDLDKDGNKTESMANTYMGGGKYYKMGGQYEHGGLHSDPEFLVRDAEKMRDRNPRAYYRAAADAMNMLARNEGYPNEMAATFDPLQMEPSMVQEYLNYRAGNRKDKVKRTLGGILAAMGVGYLSSAADTEGFYREGSSERYLGQAPEYVSVTGKKLSNGTILTPGGTFPDGQQIPYHAFIQETRPDTRELVNVPVDREVGEMTNFNLLLQRLLGNIYKGKRYE